MALSRRAREAVDGRAGCAARDGLVVIWERKADYWRGVRVVEGARLESVCTFIAYRGFESLPLRHIINDLAANHV